MSLADELLRVNARSYAGRIALLIEDFAEFILGHDFDLRPAAHGQ